MGNLVARSVCSLAPLTSFTHSAALCNDTFASLAHSVHGLAYFTHSLVGQLSLEICVHAKNAFNGNKCVLSHQLKHALTCSAPNPIHAKTQSRYVAVDWDFFCGLIPNSTLQRLWFSKDADWIYKQLQTQNAKRRNKLRLLHSPFISKFSQDLETGH